MKAIKGNKVYAIDQTMKADYVARGFDIIEDNGDIIEYGAGKTVPYGDYKKIEEENIRLNEENKSLKDKLLALELVKDEEEKPKGKGK